MRLVKSSLVRWLMVKRRLRRCRMTRNLFLMYVILRDVIEKLINSFSYEIRKSSTSNSGLALKIRKES